MPSSVRAKTGTQNVPERSIIRAGSSRLNILPVTKLRGLGLSAEFRCRIHAILAHQVFEILFDMAECEDDKMLLLFRKLILNVACVLLLKESLPISSKEEDAC